MKARHPPGLHCVTPGHPAKRSGPNSASTLSAGAELTNSVVHGAGSDTLRIGAESDRIVCEVHDSGQLNDPLAGRRPSHPTQPGGRGLLLVHPLADLVRVHTGPGGTTIRRYLPG
ncbi:ATP-binding protein [Streptomyces griseoluteus]|uniref:ATP-binding protein n=1 Tax=Streptomyces griseoluteus TaxID=29306 RepID=UPI003F4D13AC